MFSWLAVVLLIVGPPDQGSSSKLSLPHWSSFTQGLIATEEEEDSPSLKEENCVLKHGMFISSSLFIVYSGWFKTFYKPEGNILT